MPSGSDIAEERISGTIFRDLFQRAQEDVILQFFRKDNINIFNDFSLIFSEKRIFTTD